MITRAFLNPAIGVVEVNLGGLRCSGSFVRILDYSLSRLLTFTMSVNDKRIACTSSWRGELKRTRGGSRTKYIARAVPTLGATMKKSAQVVPEPSPEVRDEQQLIILALLS